MGQPDADEQRPLERDVTVPTFALQHLQEAAFVINEDGDFEYVNEEACRALGYGREELLRLGVPDISPTVSQEDFFRLWAELRQIRSIRFEDRHRTRDGRLIPVEINANFFEQDGRAYSLALARDISDRKRTEEALLASQQMFRAIVENSPEIVIRFDRDCRHIYVNPAMERATGMTPEWLLGRTPIETAPPDAPELVASAARAQAAAQRVLQTGENVEIEVTLVAPNGRPRLYIARFSPELDAEGGVASVVSVAYDLTQQKTAEAQLRLAQKMEGIGRLSGGIAHDFNNALGVILGESELMAERIDPADPLREELEEIRKAGEHAASLTRQLLAFSRQQVLQPRVLNLNTVVAEIEKMLRRLIGEDIDMVTSLGPDLGYTTADPGQIEQVITNLAVNARDAMPAGGQFLLETSNVMLDESESVQQGPVNPGPYVLLSVSDTGTGIPREILPNIFDPFFTTKEVGKGTGLGLATVYGIVNQSGGHISVSSVVGQGTTFRIFLPRVEAPGEGPGADRGSDPLRGAETILLVEDYEPLRKLTVKLLRSSGYTVVEAGSAAEALQIVAQDGRRLHLLLSDVVMPGMSGPQLAQLLVAQKPHLRVLLMSGYTDEAIARHGVLNPGVAFLQKPFTREALTRKVREVLAAPGHYAQLV